MEGTTHECLHDFFRELEKLEKTDVEKQKTLASHFLSFVGASKSVADGWFKGTYFPRGVDLLKVRYFLRENGYVPIETKGLDPALDLLGSLIATNAVQPTKAATDLGFSDVAEMLRLLHGTRKSSEARTRKIAEYCSSFGSEIKKENEKQRRPTSFQKLPAIENETPPVITMLSVLRDIIILLTPELDALLEATPEKRQALRDNTEDMFFKLSNRTHELRERLNALCSEKSLELFNNKKGGA